jgi:hypothetical protein
MQAFVNTIVLSMFRDQLANPLAESISISAKQWSATGAAQPRTASTH